MPKRTDIHRILIIGGGPIVIGQACEFDYSGSQACKALKEEGYEVILVNSNPATIMTDPEMADRTYIEPVTPEFVEKIVAQERPDAILPTLGGQTGLNVAMELSDSGVLAKHGAQLIGANEAAIRKAEDRSGFKKAMEEIGLDVPRSYLAYNLDEAITLGRRIGFPLVVRPSYTLGGTGGGIAWDEDDFVRIATAGLQASRISEILIEESVLGWKEYELEIMRDRADNVVIVCSIENLDPMGVHTGDSVTVAPAQTLTDRQYQQMRNAALAIIREIGVDTGGSNIQFAIDPRTGRMTVIEMNPRVSRSSALASKATGFPIAKIAAKLAVGYTLDEIANDITRKTPVCFEPTLDYCVVKIPRFAFEKFPEADQVLGTQMKSVGETMAIGRTFRESLQKAVRGLELGRGFRYTLDSDADKQAILSWLAMPQSGRLFALLHALRTGITVGEIHEATQIDLWFIEEMKRIVDFEDELKAAYGSAETEHERTELLFEAKRNGFSDSQIAALLGAEDELHIRSLRTQLGILPTYKVVDTCAAEFEAYTPYYYSTYETEDEAETDATRKVVILGGGPNRIGQGIEFDYCCCQAVFGLRELGYQTIMVNSNPETVSTDYDTANRLYFEPLTFEDVMNIIDKEAPMGVIVQLGGQTPLNLAQRLADAGAPILGTSVDSINRAEDRDTFAQLINRLELRQPPNGIATTRDEAYRIASDIGYPIVVRPSFVLGGRAMRIVAEESEFADALEEAFGASDNRQAVLIDKFIVGATEVDVDAVSDGERVVLCGIMEHIEEAGVHSGDSACILPPHSLDRGVVEEIERQTIAIAQELSVVGLINIQFAVQNDQVYILEVNPRASRTIPFVCKATGIPWVKIAARVMSGMTLEEQGIGAAPAPGHYAVKEAVLPFNKFRGSDVMLGPEMKSTGEVMGIDTSVEGAYLKSQIAAGNPLPRSGAVLMSVRMSSHSGAVALGAELAGSGFTLHATEGTCDALRLEGIAVKQIAKVGEGKPDVVDLIKSRSVSLVMNVPESGKALADSRPIRLAALEHGIPYITTFEAARAAVKAMCAGLHSNFTVKPIQDYYGRRHRKSSGA
ncbi:MAG: carbamoyl-phosphate synthase large subunit [Chitinivibrionales bacterium]|nr:carbamoyl-phosphate synthase large subunit [Chitinivibrionales bacterium]